MTLSPEAREEVALKDGWLKRDTAKAAARVAEWSSNKEPAMDVHRYVEGYEFRGDQDYTPNDHEKALIEDAILGFIGLSASPAPAASGGLEAVREAKTALELVRAIIVEAALTGFNCHTGDWAERLYASQADTHAAVKCCTAALAAPATPAGAGGEAVGHVTLFSALEAAYIRGAAWRAEMGMTHTFGELRKAACDYADKEEKDVICRGIGTTRPAPDTGASVKEAVREAMETRGPYEARICKGVPADYCGYGVVSLSEGREVCRVWREQDARAIAAALTSPATPAGAGGDVDEARELKALMKAIQRAEDGAGTLPAKEAVNLRPADWHAVCDRARKLAALSQAASAGKADT